MVVALNSWNAVRIFWNKLAANFKTGATTCCFAGGWELSCLSTDASTGSSVSVRQALHSLTGIDSPFQDFCATNLVHSGNSVQNDARGGSYPIWLPRKRRSSRGVRNSNNAGLRGGTLRRNRLQQPHRLRLTVRRALFLLRLPFRPSLTVGVIHRGLLAGKFHRTCLRPPCVTIDCPDPCGSRSQQVGHAPGHRPHLQVQ
jgi:hypothetical protein